MLKYKLLDQALYMFVYVRVYICFLSYVEAFNVSEEDRHVSRSEGVFALGRLLSS